MVLKLSYSIPVIPEDCC